MSDTTTQSISSKQNKATLSLAGPREYFALLKPRVMSLVIFTAFIGMLVAPGSLNPILKIIALLCIAVGAGASGALNMWWDADIDRIMSRTRKRPIPAGLVPRAEAATLGVALSALSVVLLALTTNYLAAGLLAFTIFFYAVIYSMWLKRATPQNIVIGGAAGALPPVVGWAAVTGAAPLEAWALFAIIFLWTPPHFWALALYREGDYARAGIPMMPVIAGEKSTRRQIFAYALILAPAGLLPWAMGFAGPVYGLAALLGGLGFVYASLKVLREPSGTYAEAKRLFGFSILYLFALFAVLGIDAILNRLGILPHG